MEILQYPLDASGGSLATGRGNVFDGIGLCLNGAGPLRVENLAYKRLAVSSCVIELSPPKHSRKTESRRERGGEQWYKSGMS